MKNLSQSVTHLVPKYWHLPDVKTAEDLVFLGKINIRQLIRYWRDDAHSLSEQVKDLEKLIKMLKNKTGKDFAKLAAGHENPKFTAAMIGAMSDSFGDLEPLDVASQNRESNATTFNMCGWCKFGTGGTGRYSYHITTECQFLYKAGMRDNDQTIPSKAVLTYHAVEPVTKLGATNNGERKAAGQALIRMEASYPGLKALVEKSKGWSTTTQRRFNTPCFMPNLSEKDVESHIKGMETQKQKLISKKQDADAGIKLLLSLEKMAEEKPALSDHRPYDSYFIDEKMVCYVANWKDRIVKSDWVTARVIDGYRHNDGCVSVRYDQKIHSGPYLEGHGGGYGMARPEILKLWEYHFLRCHPDFAKVWINSIDKHMPEFDRAKMLAALTENKFLALPASTTDK